MLNRLDHEQPRCRPPHTYAHTILTATLSRRLSEGQPASDGGLSNQRVWAHVGDGVPDGICLDVDGALPYGY